MENKKLLNYLLNDLSELDELFAEKGKNSFDAFEMEFIQSRIAGAIRLIKLFVEKENNTGTDTNSDSVLFQKHELPNPESFIHNVEEGEKENKNENPAVKNPGIWVEEKAPEFSEQYARQQIDNEETAAETVIEERVTIIENKIIAPVISKDEVSETEGQVIAEMPQQNENLKSKAVQKELELEEDEPIDIHNKRLGDSFLKEKSVNDMRSDEMSKLEHKLSNRPVTSIQSAIGINDRFQYIRELFEGSADSFVKAVADLDSMNDMKEAVDYLQANFKWKKNESSLKFVNLIKRRFPNE